MPLRQCLSAGCRAAVVGMTCTWSVCSVFTCSDRKWRHLDLATSAGVKVIVVAVALSVRAALYDCNMNVEMCLMIIVGACY